MNFAYLQLLSLVVLAAGVLKTNQRISHMNAEEMKAFDGLAQKIESLATVTENFRMENNALKAENEALKAQLAAVPPPPVVVDDSAEVVAAVAADVALIDAELAK